MIWRLILLAVLGLPSLSFYIFLLVFLAQKSHFFNETYYKLLKYGGVVDILTYVLTFLLLNLLCFPELRPFYLLLAELPGFQYSVWIPHASFHLFSLNVILISIHRLVLLKNPLEGDEKFRPFLKPAHIIIPVISLLLTGYIPFQQPRIAEAIRANELILEWRMDEGIDFFRITVISSGFYAAVIAGLSAASFCLLQSHRNLAKTLRKLYVISLITNTVQVGFALVMTLKIVTYYVGEEMDRFMDYYVLPLYITIACLSPAWIHLCLNKSIREQMKKSFRR